MPVAAPEEVPTVRARLVAVPVSPSAAHRAHVAVALGPERHLEARAEHPRNAAQPVLELAPQRVGLRKFTFG